MTTLLQLDTQLSLWLHQTFSDGFLEGILPFWRSKYFWIPLYVGVFAQLLLTIGRRQTFFWVICAVSCIALADMVSSQVIKKTVRRIRPCNEVRLDKQIHELVPCGVGFSFPSSHAANHMAMAAFWSLTIGRPRSRRWRIVAYFWAGSIGLAQVIVGVHYVGDVVFGSLLGLSIGLLVSYGYHYLLARLRSA